MMILQKLCGENSKEAKKLADKLEIQESKQNSLQKTIEKANNDILKAKTRQQEIQNAIDETNKQLVSQNDKLKINKKSWQESGEKLKKYGEKIDKIGNKLSIVSGAVGGIAAASLKSAIDFETAFTGVTKTVDGTEEQLANLKKGILDMSTRLPSSASEIASVAEAAGQLGIQTDNILDFTKVMIDLGNSTNVSADEASTALAKFANVTKMSADDYQKLGSTIVALGNNYATTEADIIAMGQNLASAGTQVGMSQADIMALATALSSVGLEAQAGGTAFSKALVSMQLAVETNSEDLKNWADVAGMSVKEFSDLFKKDATSALEAFIKGLSECGGETESAIKVLDDMGITETRMRDALLRSANASNTFTSAIKLGNDAWKKNTALTEEAEKRYGTTESQMKMLKNEVQKTAIEFGEELAPSLRDTLNNAKPLLKNIASAVKTFSKLNDEQKQTIINIGATVVALGPLVKVFGNLTKMVGSTVKGIGTVTKAVGLMKNGIGDATGASADLAKGLKNLASPVGIAVGTIGALTTAVGLYKSSFDKATEANRKALEKEKEELEAIKEKVNSYKELKDTVDKNTQTELNQIDRAKSLWSELQKITDENGKIKDGYEDRAKVITGTLSEAIGKEISITGDVIDKYKDLQKEMDNLILKKQAETTMNNLSEKYENAYANRDQYQADKIKKEEEYRTLKEEYDELKNSREIQEILKDGERQRQGKLSAVEQVAWAIHVKTSKEFGRFSYLEQQLNSCATSYQELDKLTKDCTDDIGKYEYALTLYNSGTEEDLKKLTNLLARTHTENGKVVDTAYKDLLRAQTDYLAYSQEKFNEAQKNNNEAQMEQYRSSATQAKETLQMYVQEMKGLTSATEENSEEIVNAWKFLAQNQYSVYYDEVSKMNPTLRETIEKMTGVIIEERPELVEETSKMSQELLDKINKSPEFKQIALSNLRSYLQGLKDDELRNLLENSGIENVDRVLQGIRKGNLGENEGMQILNSLNTGLENKSWKKTLFETARGIASSLSKLLSVNTKITTTTTNNSTGHADGLAYVPYDNYPARLHEGERVLTKEQNKKYMADNLQNKITTRNIVVQFYPQTMSEAELQRAERYIAREWGAAL